MLGQGVISACENSAKWQRASACAGIEHLKPGWLYQSSLNVFDLEHPTISNFNEGQPSTLCTRLMHANYVAKSVKRWVLTSFLYDITWYNIYIYITYRCFQEVIMFNMFYLPVIHSVKRKILGCANHFPAIHLWRNQPSICQLLKNWQWPQWMAESSFNLPGCPPDHVTFSIRIASTFATRSVTKTAQN